MKKPRETQKSRYAALAQFVAMANLLDPKRDDYPALAWLEAEIDRHFASWQRSDAPENQKIEAYSLYQQALAFKAEIIEPLWQRAISTFPVPAADVPYGEGLPRAAIAGHLFRHGDEFYEAALAVRCALGTLATQRGDKLPIRLLPAAPHRVQIVNGVIYRAPDLVRDVLLPALQGASIEIIQRCPVCDRLVLAVRQRKHQTCSLECANIERVKRFRHDNPGYYTAAARRARQKRC